MNRISEERKKKKFAYEKPVFKGPVCTCFARKFFGETLQCCQTRMKKFKDPSEADSGPEGSDIEDGDNIDVSVLKRTKKLQPKGAEEFLTQNEQAKVKGKKKTMLFEHPKTPKELENLYNSKTDHGKFLHKHSNPVNQSLAMTSIGANFKRWDGKQYINEKEQSDQKRGFNPTPTIQGKLFHRIGPITAGAGQTAKFGQIYMIDGSMADQADQRLNVFNNFNVSKEYKVRNNDMGREVLMILQRYLEEHYPYIKIFKTCMDILKESGEEEYSVVLQAKKGVPSHVESVSYTHLTLPTKA